MTGRNHLPLSDVVPMILESLQLHQFRCFTGAALHLDEGGAVFLGDNAQGKTSLLEAMCILLRLQSPRTSQLADCAQFGMSGFRLSGAVRNSEDQNRLEVQHLSGRRQFAVDGERQKRSPDFLRYSARVVWMGNEDLTLVRGGGEGRRRSLDFAAGQLFPGYRAAAKAYEKALRSRNFLLKKNANPSWQQIDAYTALLEEHGRIIMTFRNELIERLRPHVQIAYEAISQKRSETIGFSYKNGSGEDGNLLQKLADSRTEELRRRQTAAGPHRDDLALLLGDMPIARFGSEGQQRTMALALKLGQALLFQDICRTPPILLIDDIFGELDSSRRNALMKAWPKGSQKMLTTTNLNWLDDADLDLAQFDVREATLHSREPIS